MPNPEECGINIGNPQLEGNGPVKASFPLTCDKCPARGTLGMSILPSYTDEGMKRNLVLGVELFLEKNCRRLKR